MRATFVFLLVGSLLAGCVSKPPTRQEQAESAAAFGMMLLVSAGQQDPATRKLLQVRIPPAALKLIDSIEAFRASAGRWPSQEDLKLPPGIDKISLEATNDLTVVAGTESTVLIRFQILKDGTVVIAPQFEDLIAVMRKLEALRRNRIFPSIPVYPIWVAPKK